MSLGYGAKALLLSQDDKTVVYRYGGYNLNEPAYRNEDRLCDGMLTIRRSCFAEPEIHTKTKKTPGGRKKLVTKRIPVDVDYPAMVMDGRIVVRNCSCCWQLAPDGKTDIMAGRLLHILFRTYQEEGCLSASVTYFV